MGLHSSYEELPWIIQSTNPFVIIVGAVFYYQLKLGLNLFEFLGVTFSVISSFYLIFHFGKFLYRNWIGIMLGHNTDLTKLGSWAVITGPTQGIGRAYAASLARRRLNLVLIARSSQKLANVSAEIREQFPDIKIKVIEVDFTGGMEVYDMIEKEIKGMEVGLLVNNVGMCYQGPEYFTDLPGGRKFCQDLINCNMLSVTQMTQICLPGMLERKKGVVVNVGSFSSVLDAPFMTLYGASKSFVDKLTLDLDLEYAEHGIVFQSVIPGYIVSSMSKVKKSNLFVPTPDDFVEAALTAVGLQKRTTVWMSHQFLHFIVHMGQFFRRDGAFMVTRILGKQFWFYGKKVMMYRNKKSG